MKAKTRFLKSVIKTAQEQDTTLPWTRGAPRRASILRRRAVTLVARSA